ncbi:MAG: hypothetical protein RMK20_06575 [Verrucomicrobiales bacterium]|nr:hypothetical protein [Verrucomicrobiales bacterium]
MRPEAFASRARCDSARKRPRCTGGVGVEAAVRRGRGRFGPERERLEPFVTAEEPFVQENAATLAEKRFALFFDAHRPALVAADLHDVGFQHRLVEKPDLSLDLLAIDPDVQLTQQLVEFELKEVTLRFSNFEAEFHTRP